MWRWADMSCTGSADERRVSSRPRLSQAIEPPRGLWPQIEARINAERRSAPAAQPRPARARAVPPRWLAAAAVMASVAVGVWIGRSLLPAPGPGVQSPGSARASFAAAPTALDVAYVSGPRYQRDRAALMKSLQTRPAAPPPPARAQVMASLAAIQRAKQDLQSPLGKDPGNALLQELLVNTYQDEMPVLTDIPPASHPGRGI